MTSKTKEKKWEPQEIQYLKNNLQTQSNKKLALHLNMSFNQVKGKIDRLGIKRKYIDPINSNLFDNVTKPEVAYLLGYWWADASVRGQKNQFMFTIQEEDALEIRDMMLSLGNFSIYKVKKVNENHKNLLTFWICSRSLYEFLMENGYYTKSQDSPTKILNTIPKHLHHYFWLGFLDGDGSIHCDIDSKITFGGSFSQNWSDLQSLCLELDIEYSLIRRIMKHGKGSVVEMHNYQSILKFLNYLYKDRNKNNIGLKRKHSKYLKIISAAKKYLNDGKGGVNSTKYGKYILCIMHDKKFIVRKTFLTIEDAFDYKKCLIKKFRTKEYILRELLDFHSYDAQIENFKIRDKKLKKRKLSRA